MSVRAITWAWGIELKAVPKLVLLALADHANDEDFACWPSHEHLAKKCGQSKRTVINSINDLIDAGLIKKRKRGFGRSTLYYLSVGQGIEKTDVLGGGMGTDDNDGVCEFEVQELHLKPESAVSFEVQELHTVGAGDALTYVQELHTNLSKNLSKNLREGLTPCPHDLIINLYHEVLPMCPPVRDWTNYRKKLLIARWSEKPERQDLDYWRRLFGYVRDRCPWLVGRSKGFDGRYAVKALPWILEDEHFLKLIEGGYEDVESAIG